MSAIAGYNASISWAGGTNVTLTDEVLTDSGDHTTFHISSSSYATKRYWDKTATFVVQTSTDGGSTWGTAAASTYTIRYVTGQVTFTGAITGTPGCRIHAGAYLPINSAGNAKLWELTPSAAKYDSTVFGGFGSPVAWKTYLPGILDAQIKLSQWWADGSWLAMLTQTGGDNNLVVLSLYTGRSQYERYEGFARLSQDDVKVAVNALIEEPLDFQNDGPWVYLAGQYS